MTTKPPALAILAALAFAFAAPRAAVARARPQVDPTKRSGLVVQKYAGRATGRAELGGKAAEAVQKGLEWLERHQSQGGRWDCDGFMAADKTEPKCDGPGEPEFDVGVTGLALLALLADVDSLKVGRHERALWDGLKWLREQQQENGLFGTNQSTHFIYNHAIATYAMCDAAALDNDPVLRQAAQLGINYLESHRNPYSVWRYQPRDNDNDTSVTGWCVMAYATAKAIGLTVNDSALLLAGTWFDQISDPTGKHGYLKVGEVSARMPGDHDTRFPPEMGEALTAIALQCRFFLGQDPAEVPVMKTSAALILMKPPQWDPKRGCIDLYYWYHASQALAQVGGPQWEQWRKALHPALLSSQRRDGNFAGSWDPIDVWGGVGGRVYSTALAVLSLQAEYRYARILTLTPLPDQARFMTANQAWRTKRYGTFDNQLGVLTEKFAADAEVADAVAAARVTLAEADQAAKARLDGIRQARDFWQGRAQLEEIVQQFGQLPTGAAARTLLDEWRADPAVKRELQAMERYASLEKRFNAAKDDRGRKALRHELEQFARQFEGTRAAALTAELLKQIQ